MRGIRVALVGQPNVGKSTLFNVLTGESVRVANWPGTTVSKYEGEITYRGRKIHVVDLPGIYGLSTLTIEERIARKYILGGEADAYVVLVDATLPEKTLALALQVLEITPKVVVVFTKMDMVHSRGIHINLEGFSNRLGVPVVGLSAAKGYGINSLLDAIINVAEGHHPRKPLKLDYGVLELYIEMLEDALRPYNEKVGYPIRWAAIKLLEGDSELIEELRERLDKEVFERVMEIVKDAERQVGKSLREYIAITRFSRLMEICRGLVLRRKLPARASPALANIFYNPIAGPLVSFGIILALLIIAFTINTGFPLTLVLERLGFEEAAALLEQYSVSNLMGAALERFGAFIKAILGEGPLTSLIVDGVLGGVGAILAFLPLIAIVSAGFAVLEDSGVLPRVAVGTHSLFSKIGLSGHSVFPVMTSFGCNVPGVLVTRATPNAWERLKLILTVPFIPCQARLVVILALASAIGPLGGLLAILTYVIAIVVFAMLNALVDRALRSERQAEILLELPPLHKPIPKVVWWTVKLHVTHFLTKAGIVILAASLALWFLTSFDAGLSYVGNVEDSIGGAIAGAISPVLSPFGISGIRATIVALSLIVGFVAKELVISALLISTGAETVQEALGALELSPAQVASLMIFTTLYVPCVATLIAIYTESRSAKIALAAIALMLSIAYVTSLVIYWLLSLLT